MRFICLGFYDEAAWKALPEEEQKNFMETCFAYDDELRWSGHFAGGEALQSTQQAVTVRPSQGKAIVTDGPYAETKEQLGGILILEARDLNHAIQLISHHPGIRAGGFEIRAVNESVNEVYAQWKAQQEQPS